jgi:hypothetical protein
MGAATHHRVNGWRTPQTTWRARSADRRSTSPTSRARYDDPTICRANRRISCSRLSGSGHAVKLAAERSTGGWCAVRARPCCRCNRCLDRSVADPGDDGRRRAGACAPKARSCESRGIRSPADTALDDPRQVYEVERSHSARQNGFSATRWRFQILRPHVDSHSAGVAR